MKQKCTTVLFLFVFLLSLSFVAAADVAYIYSKEYKIDSNIIQAFQDQGLSVDLIDEVTLPINYNSYRLLFVGDERFKREHLIPVGDVPIIVANSYHGDDWKLVDDSVFQLVRINNPLDVRLTADSSLHDVYTQALYTEGKSIGIPYLYLRNSSSHNDMAPGLVKVAATNQDGGNPDLGAVIAYGGVGGYLHDNTPINANLCFFGIDVYNEATHSSNFWTAAAEELFIDCLDFVAVTCEEDSDCGVETTGPNYCAGDDVYRDVTTPVCEMAGTYDSVCSTDMVAELVETCDYGCGNGVCLAPKECEDEGDNDADGLIDEADPGCWTDPSDPHTYDPKDDDESDYTILCSDDSECGVEGFVGDAYCINDDVYQDYETPMCLLPGTGLSQCDLSVEQVLLEVCAYGCSDGSCLNECSLDSDCGTDFYSDKYCSGDDVYRDFHDFSCGDGECDEDVTPELVETCVDTCSDGACIDNRVHDVAIIDSGNSVDGILLEYENGTDILDEKPTLSCFDVIKARVVVENQGDFAENITVDGNLDNSSVDFILHNIENSQPGDTNTRSSLVPYIVLSGLEGEFEVMIEALITGDDDLSDNVALREIVVICEVPECSIDSDCGTDFYTDDYCSGDSVYRDFHDFSCDDGECDEDVTQELVEECAYMCSDGACVPPEIMCHTNADCDDDDAYTVDECNLPGTASSYCSHTPVNCVVDNDCGFTGFFGTEFCSQDDVFKNYQTAVCENPGTKQSYCNLDITQTFLKDCGIDSCSEQGDPFCSGGDVYIAQVCTDKGCASGACFTNTDSENMLLEECVYGCSDGSCIVPECSMDSDCGTDFYSDNYCTGDDVYRDFHDFSCDDGDCDEDVTPELVEVCADTCSNGACVDNRVHDVAIIDSGNSVDGILLEYVNGTDILGSNPVLSCFDVIKARVSVQNQGDFAENITVNGDLEGSSVDFALNDIMNSQPGDTNTRTSLSPYIILSGISGMFDVMIEADISQDDDLSDNVARRKITVVCEVPECSMDSDCGTDFYTDDYCQGDDVYRDFHNFSCDDGDCEEDVTPELVEECAYMCSDGACVPPEIMCYTDADCDDDDVYTVDECNNPGTPQSFCTNTPINCVSHNDCGFTGFFGQSFCSQDDVFKNFQTATCENPGTKQSFCTLDLTQLLLQDCGVDSCTPDGDLFCIGDDVYQTEICTDRGCASGACFIDTQTEDVLVEECAYQCVDGACVTPECTLDSDCGTDFYSDNYCTGDDVYRDFHDFSCDDGDCDEDVTPELVEECADTCNAGMCIDVCTEVNSTETKTFNRQERGVIARQITVDYNLLTPNEPDPVGYCGFRPNTVTQDAFCREAGYDRSTGQVTTSKFSSCHDNCMAYFDPAADTFKSFPACQENLKINTITCERTVTTCE